MEAIKLDGKAHSSHSVMRISFQWNTEVNFKKKGLFFVGFTSTPVWLWRSPYLKCSFYCVISFGSGLLFELDNVVYVAFYLKYVDDFTTSKP